MHKQYKREQATAMRRHTLTRAIAVTLAFGMAGSAFAQDAAQPATPAQDQTAAQQAQELDVITVTANKREENIREVAVAITKIDAQQLENLNATQITDFANYVPGFQVQSYGSPGQTQVSMRGIAALSPGSTVGTYVDETPVGSNSLYQQATLYQLDLLPYDVESVEILRGPQGTLYGAGAMGGLIKYTMKKPDPTMSEYRIGYGASSTDGADGWGSNYRLGANIPLSERFAMRASYAANDIAGYIDNLADGREDINDGEQTSARASLYWEGDATSVHFAAMRQTVESENNSAVALEPGTEARIAGLSNFIGVDEPFEKDVDHYSLTVEWDAGFADFISATSYADTSTRVVNDLTYSFGEYPLLVGLPPGITYIEQNLDLTQFTQEFRLQSKSGQPFEWLLGAFYTDEDGDNHQFIPLLQADGSPLPPPFDSVLGILGDLFIPSTYEETAVFANASYRFTDRFKLGGGVRFARNEQEFTQNSVRGLLIPPGVDFNTSSEDVFTWSITPQFQITEETMVYAKASTGYQPGGPNVVAPGLPPQVDSSMLTSYELGLKTAFQDNRVLLDLVGYQIDWEDIQVASEVNGISGLVNGGVATSRGIEASLQWRPVDGLTIGLNGAYNDAELDEDFPVIAIPDVPLGGGVIGRVDVYTGLAGDRMPYVPDLTWSFTADYFLPVANGWSLGVGGGWRWVDDRANSTSQLQIITATDPALGELDRELTQPLVISSYGALDLWASLGNQNWTLRGYVRNATDERGYSLMGDVTSEVTGVTHHNVGTPITPRTIGFEVDYRF